MEELVGCHGVATVMGGRVAGVGRRYLMATRVAVARGSHIHHDLQQQPGLARSSEKRVSVHGPQWWLFSWSSEFLQALIVVSFFGVAICFVDRGRRHLLVCVNTF